MVEVFKTNVTRKKVADRIVARLQEEFKHYQANFDLDDVDRILRVVCRFSVPDAANVIRVVREAGFEAEVLPDTPAPHHTGQLWNKAQDRMQAAFYPNIILNR